MRSIDGYRQVLCRINETRVIAAEEPPNNFTGDLVVAETDTYRVLDEETRFRNVAAHPVRILTAALDASPLTPGSVIARGGLPFRLLAVVYDFDREPICHPDWLREAWQNILRKAAEMKSQNLSTPLLGQKEPVLSFRQRAELFYKTFADCETGIFSVWLQLNGRERREWSCFLNQDEK